MSKLPIELLRSLSPLAAIPSRYAPRSTFPRCLEHRRLLSSSAVRLANLSSPQIPTLSPKQSRSTRSLFLGALATLSVTFVGAYFLLFQPDEPKLSPFRFTPLKLLSVRKESEDASVFVLALPEEMGPAAEDRPHDEAIQSVYLMQPDLQIQRAYTPLDSSCFSSKEKGDRTIELLVKRYENGELSRWLHSLRVGDEVRVRGPVLTYDSRNDAVDEVTFIVGGTGITPAYQLLQRLSASSASLSPLQVRIVYASPSPASIMLKASLDSVVTKMPNASIHYLVDSAGSEKKMKDVTVGLIHPKLLRQWIGPGGPDQRRRLVIVCGPEGMVNAVAGPRARNMSQGPVGGMLQELGYTSSQVVKL